jgi:hypothetical protein
MARMKIEVQAARAAKHGLSLRDRLIGWMPRYAPYAAMMPWLFNARDRYPMLKKLSQRFVGLSARRTLPQWRSDVFRDPSDSSWPGESREATSSRLKTRPSTSRSQGEQDADARHEPAAGPAKGRTRGIAVTPYVFPQFSRPTVQ